MIWCYDTECFGLLTTLWFLTSTDLHILHSCTFVVCKHRFSWLLFHFVWIKLLAVSFLLNKGSKSASQDGFRQTWIQALVEFLFSFNFNINYLWYWNINKNDTDSRPDQDSIWSSVGCPVLQRCRDFAWLIYGRRIYGICSTWHLIAMNHTSTSVADLWVFWWHITFQLL